MRKNLIYAIEMILKDIEKNKEKLRNKPPSDPTYTGMPAWYKPSEWRLKERLEEEESRENGHYK